MDIEHDLASYFSHHFFLYITRQSLKTTCLKTQVRYVEGENKYKDNISIEPGAPIFPVALLVEIEESRVDETILQFRIHSVDDEETFVMSRMEIRVVELLHRATRSRRERNQVDLRSSLWPGSLGVIVVQPNSTLRLDLLPLLRPMRQVQCSLVCRGLPGFCFCR